MDLGRIQLKPYVAFFQELLLEGVLMKRHINEDPTCKICTKTKIVIMFTKYDLGNPYQCYQELKNDLECIYRYIVAYRFKENGYLILQ